VPTFIYGSREDHRAVATAYASTSILTGPLKFVLGASGHIAGVINPPAKKKRSYWVNDGDLPEAADDWFAGATEQPGSWWTTGWNGSTSTAAARWRRRRSRAPRSFR
jgi:polyhydroxyalkanoate synthase